MIELIPNCIVDGSDDDLYVVKSEHGTKWIVNLVNHECDCQKWQLGGIVCVHVIDVLYPRRMSWTEYCSSFYHVRSYLLSYSGNIKPMRDMKEWPKPTDPNKIVRPPPFERGSRRPRKQRIGEEYDKDIRRGKSKRRKMTCTRCKKQGHNSRTCKGIPASETGRKNTTIESVDSVPPNSGPVTSVASYNTHVRRPTARAIANVVDQGSSSRDPTPPPTLKSKSSSSYQSREIKMQQKQLPTAKEKWPSAKQVGKKSGPEHRHNMGDLLVKQHHKSTIDVLIAAREAFGALRVTPPQTREPTPYPWPVQAPTQAPSLST
ncbi:hypothetical protein IFM89_037317 [Coptis chinensis]|uniref:SWIM-type domain-containing protein n=1 Tax=Coptis chinensis TaxID=261450 RepID=A0A835HUT6_9MAGN|nr:hypothetical protein IFM89_037317 [Coptis chinensis]